MDVRYLGPPDRRHNAELRAEPASPGVWDFSDDGTCSGTVIIEVSVVRAPDVERAAATCAGFGHSTDEAPINLAYGGYAMPPDAWACVLRFGELPL